MIRWLFGFLLALGAAAPSFAADPPAAGLRPVRTVEGIVEYRLANGLQVLLAQDDSKPTTTVNVTYRVGSRHENYGETGMAHLLEHLLFKGTPTHRNVWGEFTRRGLRANGSTWIDRTNYFASFTANEENLRWYLAWQADAMVNSFIARKDLDSEMTVVRNEMESGENDPTRILLEKTLATMYQWHNYGKSTIGARADVENVDIARLQAFYRTYYQPDNATLIVAGKFDPAKVIAWVQRDFGKIPRPKRTLPRLYTIDPVQDGERAVTLRRPGGSALVFSAYHTPPGSDAAAAAFELLGLVMTEAPSGRLHRALVDSRLAAAVFSFNLLGADPGATLFGAQLAPGGDIEAARAALLATVEGLAATPLTAEEVERARAKWLKDWDLQFSDPETVGVALSEFIALGDWRLYFLLRDRVRAATVDDVQKVGAAYVLASNRTLGLFVPTDQPVRAPAPARVDVAAQLADWKPVETIARAEAFDATPANIETRTKRFTVAPGLKVALLPKGTRGDVVKAQLRLLIGDEKSLAGREQTAEILAALLDKGTDRLSRQQVRDRLTELKAEVAFASDGSSIRAAITATKATLPQTIELVAQMLRRPAFDPAVLEEVRQAALAAVAAQRTEPEALVEQAIYRHGNPYPRGDLRHQRSFDEIVADIGAVTVDGLRDFHARFVGLGTAQFAAVGAMDADAVRTALEQGLGGWAAAAPFQRIPRPLVELPPVRIAIETPDKQNATLQARLPIPVRELDADRAALNVANFVVGSGGNSRLWKRIRETEGLSYGVYSYVAWSPIDANSEWIASAIFAPQNRAKVESAFRDELERAQKQGFSAAEIEQAKAGLLNYRRLARAQDETLAGDLLQNEYLGRDMRSAQQLDDAIAAVTADQAMAAWRKYVDPARLVLGVAGDFKGR